MRTEIFVADITASDNSNAIVDDHGFIVHPPVHTLKVYQPVHPAPAAVFKRVKKLNVKVAATRQVAQQRLDGLAVVIIE